MARNKPRKNEERSDLVSTFKAIPKNKKLQRFERVTINNA